MSKRKEAALAPRLRFSEFYNDGAIKHENGSEIFEAISDKNHDCDIPVLAVTQEHGAIPRDQIDYNVSVTDKSLKSYKVVEIGDFIISLRSFQGGIEYSLYHGICSPAYIILRKKVPVVEQYYKHYFKTAKFIQDLNKDLEGIRDGKMVSYSQFSSILLPRPKAEEQQKIADCLSSIDDLIAVEDKKLEALKTHKKGLMQKLFPAEGKTVPEWRFPEFRDSGDWEEYTLSETLDSIVDNRGKTPNTAHSGIALIEVGAIGNFNINYSKVKKYVSKEVFENWFRVHLKHGDILFSTVGKIGLCSYYNHSVVAAVAQNVVGLRFSNNHNSVFMFYLLSEQNNNKYIQSIVMSAVQPSIKITQFIELVFSIPSLSEQQKIADCLSSIDAFITEQAKKVEALKAHKKGLMQSLFPSVAEVSK